MTAETAPTQAPAKIAEPDIRLLKFAEAVTIPALALVASALIFSVFLVLIGKDPVQFFSLIWTGGFGSSFSFQNSLQRAER